MELLVCHIKMKLNADFPIALYEIHVLISLLTKVKLNFDFLSAL